MKQFCIALIFLAGCTNTPDKIITTTPDSAQMRNMKGFEIYVFEKNGKTFYTLLPGTNREKTMDEVYDEANAVEGLESIKQQTNNIAAGEYVMIRPIGIDSGKLNELRQHLISKGLEVTISKQTGF